MNTVEFTASIEKIRYENEEFKILQVHFEEAPNTCGTSGTVTGYFSEIEVGESYHFTAEEVVHPKYGLQWKVIRYERAKPSNRAELIQYFSSAQFPKVGKKTAEKLIAHFGEDLLAQLVKEPERLDECAFLNQQQKEVLKQGIQENYGRDQILLSLQSYKLTLLQSQKIYKRYREQSLEKVQQNPYCLLQLDLGLSFERVDQLAHQLHISKQAPCRLEAALCYCLAKHCYQSGDTYLDLATLLTRSQALLEKQQSEECSFDSLSTAFIDLSRRGQLVYLKEQGEVYLKDFFEAESDIAFYLEHLASCTPEISDKELNRALARLEKKSAFTYGASQKRALKKAFQSNVFVLTGGPGTGKTTIIRAILELYADLYACPLDGEYTESPFHLVAPTGRAARRMSETTGLPASTIHRLLGLGHGEESKSAKKEIEQGILIVDEFSMVDIFLCRTLLEAVHEGVKVIFVGDSYQLPSVGPGQILEDLLQAQVLASECLTNIYRQSKDSTLIDLAYHICQGEVPANLTARKKDRSFFEFVPGQLSVHIQRIVELALKKGYTAKTLQVLAPTYKGPDGITALNHILQEILNPPAPQKQEYTYRQLCYREGDKVINLTNDVDNNIFNGDIGFVTEIHLLEEGETKSGKDEVWVDFGDAPVCFTSQNLEQLNLAYCCSVHKSQGSEYPLVIIPMVTTYPKPLLKRNLLYTAVTRSKDRLILLGEKQAFIECIQTPGSERKTGLVAKLRRCFSYEEATLIEEGVNATKGVEEEGIELEDTKLTLAKIYNKEVPPLIGMNGKRPEDFLTKKREG